MRFSKALELSVLEFIDANPGKHVVFEDEAYEKDRGPVVYRDDRRYPLVNYLWSTVGWHIPKGKTLIRDCSNEKCVNPHHYVIGKRRRVRKTCPNGHRYKGNVIEVNGQRRCKICHDARFARRPRKTSRRIGICKNGHDLTNPENTYEVEDKAGRLIRRCRICTLAREKELRDRARAARQSSSQLDREEQP
jgi:hypothetical protein